MAARDELKTPLSRDRANRRTGLLLAAAALGMVGMGYALVPLYEVFCEVTGLNGKTGVIAEARAKRVQEDTERWVTVEFDANVNSALPWQFGPVVRRMRVHPGEIARTRYYVENRSGYPVTGQAVPSVVPALASRHFDKVECFCFSRQTLQAGERRDMPVRFVVHPELPANVSTVTLSYTFFEAPDRQTGTAAEPPLAGTPDA